MENNVKRFYLAFLLRCTIILLLVVNFIYCITQFENGYDVLNFFAFFTNLSNIAVLFLMLVLVLKMIKNFEQKQISQANAGLYLFVVFMITSTLIIFTGLVIVLIAVGYFNTAVVPVGDMLTNINMHYIIPALVLLDYHYFIKHKKIKMQTACIFTSFTFLYFFMLLLRAKTNVPLQDMPEINYVSLYPYPFLDVNFLSLPKLILSLSLCGFGFLFFSSLLIIINNKLSTKEAKVKN